MVVICYNIQRVSQEKNMIPSDLKERSIFMHNMLYHKRLKFYPTEIIKNNEVEHRKNKLYVHAISA